MSAATHINGLEKLQELLAKTGYKFFFFKSQVDGLKEAPKELDLAFTDEIDVLDLREIQMDLQEVDFKFIINIIDLKICPEDFREMMAKDLVAVKDLK